MHTYCGVRYSRPAGLFSFGLLDGLQVRLRRPHVREAPADFGLERLATVFMNNPGQTRGYYEAEVRKVRVARPPKRNSGGGYPSEGRERTPYDREMERQQNVYESLRNSGFNDRAEACRTDGSKC